jgi:hypothetical protein
MANGVVLCEIVKLLTLLADANGDLKVGIGATF